MNGRLLSPFRCRHTSSPSILGIMMSSRIRSGSFSRAQESASSPSAAMSKLVAVCIQPPRKDVAVRLIVVGDEDQRRLDALGFLARQELTHLGKQLARAEGFGDVAIATGRASLGLVPTQGVRGHGDDRNRLQVVIARI